MRSACYWLPYLAYPTLPYTAQHSIAYRVRKAEAKHPEEEDNN